MVEEHDSMVTIKPKMNEIKKLILEGLILKDLRLKYIRSIQWKKTGCFLIWDAKIIPQKNQPQIQKFAVALLKVMIFYAGNGVFSFEDRCSNDCRIINSFVSKLQCPWETEKKLRQHIGIKVIRDKIKDHLSDL